MNKEYCKWEHKRLCPECNKIQGFEVVSYYVCGYCGEEYKEEGMPEIVCRWIDETRWYDYLIGRTRGYWERKS